MKEASRERGQRLRKAVVDGAYPPGTMPVSDASRQAQILGEIQGLGLRLSPQEQARQRQLGQGANSLLRGTGL